MRTSELTGAALDWAVAIADGLKPPLLRVLRGKVALPREDDPMWCDYLAYSTNWEEGGPIIHRERIRLDPREGEWQAQNWTDFRTSYGPTPLIAAMRCYVASKLGDEIEVPKEISS